MPGLSNVILLHLFTAVPAMLLGAYSGLMIAFVFTLLPGRLVGQWVRQVLA